MVEGRQQRRRKNQRDDNDVHEAQKAQATAVVVVQPPSPRWQSKLEQLSQQLTRTTGNEKIETNNDPADVVAAAIRECLQKLETSDPSSFTKSPRDNENDDDDDSKSVVAASVEQCWKALAHKLQETCNDVDVKLERALVQTTRACQVSSQRYYQQQLVVTQLQAEYSTLIEYAQDCDSRLAQGRLQLALAEDAWKDATISTEHLLKQQQEQIPNLQHQISLYASCTGIKWLDDDDDDVEEEEEEEDDDDLDAGLNGDKENDNDKADFGNKKKSRETALSPLSRRSTKADLKKITKLQGQVAIPSIQGLRQFSYDLSDNDDQDDVNNKSSPKEQQRRVRRLFDVANRLWNLMEGQPDCTNE